MVLEKNKPEPDWIVTPEGEVVAYDRDNLPLTKEELKRFYRIAKWRHKNETTIKNYR